MFMLPLIFLIGCASDKGTLKGEDGEPGEPGSPGADGEPGAAGQDCWDLNGNGVGDAEEDLNGDGQVDVLDCHGTDGDGTTGEPEEGEYYLGDLSLYTGEAAAYFCERYVGIYGSLYMDMDASDAIGASCIEEVHGDFTLRLTGETAISFPVLTVVTGNFSTAVQGSLAFPSLETIGLGARLDAEALTMDSVVSFPLLVSVSAPARGEFYVYAHGTDITSVDLEFPSLETIYGGLHFGQNRSLEVLWDFESLTTIEGDLQIRFNEDLNDVSSLHGLTTLGGSLVIEGNPSLPTSAASELAASIGSIGGAVEIVDNGPG